MTPGLAHKTYQTGDEAVHQPDTLLGAHTSTEEIVRVCLTTFGFTSSSYSPILLPPLFAVKTLNN
ncbi:hypothetical protein E2C01_099614 [Portunus trituberculatus]|uniref:Uncharacterized protein n=1 Tax=Portunus trituberculatus TaxID=210409 RepID=A0A5B7K5Y4_PORTR|nr:hypothetical protein [Portunus trituberculatus]